MRRYIRALQSMLPWAVDAKAELQRRARSIKRMPFEREFEILAYLNVPRGKVAIDVGSNRGQSIDAIRLFHPTARVISFEANQGLCERLRKRYKWDQHLELHNFGLSSRPGLLNLYVPVYRGYTYDGLASLDYESAAKWLNSERVAGFNVDRLEVQELLCEIRKLDQFDYEPAFIKIDVQGFEEQVIEGAAETIAKAKPILLVEVDKEAPALLVELRYREYSYGKASLREVANSKERSPNSLFLLETHLKTLVQSGVRLQDT